MWLNWISEFFKFNHYDMLKDIEYFYPIKKLLSFSIKYGRVVPFEFMHGL